MATSQSISRLLKLQLLVYALTVNTMCSTLPMQSLGATHAHAVTIALLMQRATCQNLALVVITQAVKVTLLAQYAQLDPPVPSLRMDQYLALIAQQVATVSKDTHPVQEPQAATQSTV